MLVIKGVGIRILRKHATILVVKKKIYFGTSLAVQWLRLCASGAGGAGLIPGWGLKIPHAT